MEEKNINGAPAQNDDVAQKPSGPVEIVGINFREAGKIYYFSPCKFKFSEGDRVIVDTSRGNEMGTVKGPNKFIDSSEVISPLKPVTRPATAEDLERDAKNHEMEFEAGLICKKKIQAHGLGMSLVAVEYTFDNSKLIFYFTCESRVDFRELVKDLAATFRTRIELRQIGIRDAAKLMGGLGVCGRKYCCSGFLSDFVQVTIKMAKEQNFSLNSAKVSGACGRLMCCLRYEHEVYEEAIKVTPPTGSVVQTHDGEGVVVETKPLAAQIRVKLNDNEKDAPKLYAIKDVKILKVPKQKKQNKDDSDEDSEIPAED
jgi:cell fate regulator YaaT (PSP1 superfamily)